MSESNVQTSEQPLLLHISAVAELLGLTIRQVRALTEEGLLPVVVITRKTYIPAWAVHEYVEGIGRESA